VDSIHPRAYTAENYHLDCKMKPSIADFSRSVLFFSIAEPTRCRSAGSCAVSSFSRLRGHAVVISPRIS
jgi:hypothetical protein